MHHHPALDLVPPTHYEPAVLGKAVEHRDRVVATDTVAIQVHLHVSDLDLAGFDVVFQTAVPVRG